MMKLQSLITMTLLSLAAVRADERETFDFGWKFRYYGLGEPSSIASPLMADGFRKGYPAALAMDGNPETYWCAMNERPGHFLRLLPDHAKKVSRLEILWENGMSKELVVVFRPVEGAPFRRELMTQGEKTVVEIPGQKLASIEIKIGGTDETNWACVRELAMTDVEGRAVALCKPEAEDGPAQPDFEEVGYKSVQLPHDWAIESPFLKEEPNETGKLPWNGYGWYRKHFSVPADFHAGKDRYYLDFDGVMSCPKVYVNGKLAGEWAYGYASFRVDITPHLLAGQENLIAVVASNKTLSTRWYPGAGIYRHVWLEKTQPAHIAYNGVCVTTPEVSQEAATVEIKTMVENTGEKPVALTVCQKVGKLSAKPVAVELRAGESREVTQHLTLTSPKLWSCESPNLYKLVTCVQKEGKAIDMKETTFGVRTIEWKPDGFYLNGRKVRLNGVCEHHDLGPLGAAFHARAFERKIEKLKVMGCNSIRTTHNPPAPEVLDLCDRHGILVIDELFDIWKHQKYDKVNGYHRFWPMWWQRDVRNFVMRDRNHPCIIAWSGGNEVPEINTPDGPAICAGLRDEFRKYDTTRPYNVGVNDVRGAYNGFADAMDVFGFNYKPWEYNNFSDKRPAQPFIASETASCTATRGTFFLPFNTWDVNGGQNSAFRLFQVSAYGLFAPGWGYAPDIEFSAQDDNGKVAGEYVWTGFDYLGEPTPYNQDQSNMANMNGLSAEQKKVAMAMLEKMGKKAPSRSSYFGIIDLAGFPKDTYYSYQSQWRPDLKQAHIIPHWNWRDHDGQEIPVMVFSSGDEAELFLNGKSQGVRRRGEGDTFCQARNHVRIPKCSYRFAWEKVKYEPGELKVVVRKNGKIWATAERVTTGAVAAVKAEVDRNTIAGDARDLAFIELAAVDAKGNIVPAECREVQFSVTGPAELVGFCNGNPLDHRCMQDPEQEFFNGRILAVVRGLRGQSGRAVVTVQAEGLPSIEVPVTILPATPEQLKH